MLNSNYAPDSDGFSGVQISDLIQSPQFYSEKREDTMRYLISVYPMGKESFEKLNDLQLASFYNSLNYYYNYDSDSSKIALPYPPQGWFFNFYTYQKYNIPRIFSDSNENKEELKLQNFVSNKDRIIQRDIWFPNGLSNTKMGNEDVWQYVVNKKITWNYPHKWFEGFPDYSYTEVIMPSQLTLGCWWEYVTGSGIFLNVGKSLRVKNKLEAVYTLLKKMKKDFLKKHFETDNIYDIIYTIIVKCLCDSVPCQQDCEPDYEGILKESGLPVKNFETEIKRFQKQNNIKDNKGAFMKSVDAAINNLDYRLNRISSKVMLNEIIFFLGMNTDYDTIQLSFNPNMNGYYTFEIVDLRVPNKYLDKAKIREYSNLIQSYPEIIHKFINEEIISIRDPLDLKNNNKVQKYNITKKI